ncbi:unnamed protein product [Rotaria sp. Silwood2]|nr:unnamed protein product [Rotaria sp. Silwood2]
MPDTVPSKRTSDLWVYKTKSETIKTYADYFENKLPHISIDRDSLMATMKPTRNPRINYLYQVPTTKKNANKNPTTDLILDQPVYYPIELLHYAPVNQADLKLFYKLPSILVRLTQLYWIEQLRILFASNIQTYSLMDVKQMRKPIDFNDCLKNMDLSSATTLFVTRRSLLPLTSLTYDSLTIKNKLMTNEQPSSDVLFQAITRRSSGEQMDNENFEILGDCFLKLAVSMSLYYRYHLASAGLLTAKKIKQISNENLYRLVVKKQLKNYLNVNKIVFRGKDANWLPPGYSIDETKLTISEQFSHQKAKRKAFSDMIEAFIGAFLISSNYKTTIEFMHWLGLDVIPINEQVTDIRQDLSNNSRLAYILVACGLHRKILHNSTDLFGHISLYAGDEDLFPKDQSTEQYLSKDLDRWANSTAPKALADVFEALVGAIFLDSGNCLETVWRVVEPLLRKYLGMVI